DLWLTDLLEIHFVELRKLQEQSVGIERRLVRWMLFLTAKTKERLEELAMAEPVMQKALTTLEFLSQDKRTRELYEQRQKGLQTYAADMEGAREEGREEGEHLRAQFTARNLLAMGMEVEAIARVTDLPILEVEKIQREMGHSPLN
ncbi:Rpn family recombination-promoting nuclease/putative transposase, partial [Alicyclobacillaceae bacterium I2511]